MPTALDYQLGYRFEELGRQLQASAAASPAAATQGEVPLAFWALPKDRRLPRALLGRSTRQIVQTPFAKLYATPGIGTKKLVTLIQLLERALAAGVEAAGSAPATPGNAETGVAAASRAPDFDPRAVSESQWAKWCALVKRHGLTSEPLGRFAVTLQDLPSVMWHTPLAEYVDLTLAQVRRRKTHGEKRVRAVTQVLAMAYRLLGNEPPPHLVVRVVPSFVAPLEAWLLQAARGSLPAASEVRESFTEVLLRQLRHDAGDAVANLAADRLGEKPVEFNVRAAAKELGLTRARLYQLLAQAAAVMSVRWPEGSKLVQALREKIPRSSSPSRSARLFISTAELFFPRQGFARRLAQREPPASRRVEASPENAEEDASAAAA